MIFKRNKKNDHKKQAENDLANRKGIWTPSLDDRRRLVVQDLYLSSLLTDGRISGSMFGNSVMRHSLIPLDEDSNDETRIRAESDIAALSTLTTDFLVRMHKKGDH